MDGAAPYPGRHPEAYPGPEPEAYPGPDLAICAPSGVVGPNAVVQLGHALRAHCDEETARAVYARAGAGPLFDAPPEEMIDESVPAALMDALWRSLKAPVAEAVAAEAGRRTAAYVIAHRIPRLAKLALAALPRRRAAALLLRAIERNAWTFAGSGRCEVATAPDLLISITDNPLAMPDCAWHRAVFAEMFGRLVAEGTQVRHTRCCAQGARACRFEIALPKGRGDRGA